MKRYQYTCKLLSDIVISSVTATEGFNPSLDYIPGSKFLGIVAEKIYNDNPSVSRELFHSGKVRFGDAYPVINGKTSLPIPFSWFYEKGENLADSKIYLHHQLDTETFKSLSKNGKQLKQAREGYFDEESSKYLKIDQDFNIRSAYNRQELRSDDGKMFGYFSLPQGSIWTFTVEDDTAQYGELIKKALVGKKRIGRSRSAEYGLVEISVKDKELPIESKIIPASELTLIYALSNLCFYDDFGRPTVTPSLTQLGVPEGEIIWDKSQIRSRLYQTWNRHRHNRDADRMIIEKGSVFAIKHEKPIDTTIYMNGIGSHKSEGFGQVLVNPSFLFSKQLELTKVKIDLSEESAPVVGLTSAQDSIVLSYLNGRESQKTSVFDLDKKINQFVAAHGKEFDGLSSSQWGTIRAYAKHAANWDILNKLLFDKDFGALYRGQSEASWREKNRRETLSIFLSSVHADRVSFTLKLAAEMAKRKQNKEMV